MKIAVSAIAPTLDAEVDPRFGRCQYFVIVDPQTMEFETLQNSSAMAAGGAGISTAQMVANKGVQVILTGNCGPNAYRTLSAAGLQVITGATGKIRNVVQAYKDGKFQPIARANVDSHYGMGSGSGMGGGRGMGMGKGMGRDMGMASMTESVPQAMDLKQEVNMLKSQIQALEQQLNEMQRRIEKLDKKNE